MELGSFEGSKDTFEKTKYTYTHIHVCTCVYLNDGLPAWVTPMCVGPWTQQRPSSPTSLAEVEVTHGLNCVPTKSRLEALTSNHLVRLLGGGVFTVK